MPNSVCDLPGLAKVFDAFGNVRSNLTRNVHKQPIDHKGTGCALTSPNFLSAPFPWQGPIQAKHTVTRNSQSSLLGTTWAMQVISHVIMLWGAAHENPSALC